MTTSNPPADVAQVAESMTRMLREKPVFFMDLVRAFPHIPYRTLLLAWGQVRERHPLSRDDEGHYLLARDA